MLNQKLTFVYILFSIFWKTFSWKAQTKNCFHVCFNCFNCSIATGYWPPLPTHTIIQKLCMAVGQLSVLTTITGQSLWVWLKSLSLLIPPDYHLSLFIFTKLLTVILYTVWPLINTVTAGIIFKHGSVHLYHFRPRKVLIYVLYIQNSFNIILYNHIIILILEIRSNWIEVYK